MKRIPYVVLSLLLVPALFAEPTQRLIPAGALVSCTTGDGRISSKTTAVGDPVLCKVEHRRGDFMLPYGSYLGGEFAEYKDPGHFVGKGWMQLDFDRLYVGNTVVPIDARVVDVPGYKIDNQGRILGKGHAVRDTITWMIPILWPIDLINLPRRGPRPTLKSETALTLRVMEDIQVPYVAEPQTDPYGLIPRGSSSYAPEPPPLTDDQSAPQMSYDDQQPMPYEQPAEQPMYAPPVMGYAAPMPYPMVVAPPPAIVAYGGVMIAPRPYGRVYASPYGARAYSPYRSAYVPRAVAARPMYGYGYAGRAVGGGYGARAAMSVRGGGFRGGFRGR